MYQQDVFKANTAARCYANMVRKVRGGQFGDARIDPQWQGLIGEANFAAWVAEQDFNYKADINKDLLVDTDVFSPRTCVMVPSRFNNWFYKAVMNAKVFEHKTQNTFSALFYTQRGMSKPVYFNTREEAVAFWKARAMSVIESYRDDLERSHPKIMPRLVEILDMAVEGNLKFSHHSRRELRYN